ncbi:hypothetical protein [uncultured Aquimonas sp.]|uniref:hypothetical protein n=1 Tax=uncultured Aquimonas sp. TaxID=385483 RepID=UPI0026305905|nr:hypothetical protein [uncultured Aquimonas sp.]
MSATMAAGAETRLRGPSGIAGAACGAPALWLRATKHGVAVQVLSKKPGFVIPAQPGIQ